tara:strand:- start:1022 stop:2488 length:1467 start_codon:yes stop_codon:yes gene_type:complete
MADADIKKLDEDLFKLLKKTAGAFRTYYSDKKTHAITVDLTDTKKQVWTEMARREGYNTVKEFKIALKDKPGAEERLTKIINTTTKRLIGNIYHALKRDKTKQAAKWDISFTKQSNKQRFVVTISSTGRANVLKKFKTYKAKAQRTSISAINKWNAKFSNRGIEGPLKDKSNQIRRKGEVHDGLKSKSNDPFIDIGHSSGSAIGNLRAVAAKDFLDKYIESSGGGKGQSAALKAIKALKTSGVFNWEVEGIHKKDGVKKTVTCTLESSKVNKASMTKKEVAGLNKILKQALGAVKGKDGKGWVYDKTSDSYATMAEKHLVNKLLKPIKKSKRLKVTTKVKYKKRKSTKKNVKGKKRTMNAKKVPVPAYKKVPLTILKKNPKEAGGASGAFAPLQMIGLINKELPSTVENNMGRPRLESVTGRFARSTKVTDIISTPQGFPSIGYTYQLSPYQTFEEDSDYDPRTLIDQSLRSIAVKFAMGRFYTRRVQ